MRCIVAVLLLSLMVFSMLGYQKEVRADTDTQAAIGIAEELYADTPVHILELQKLDFSSMRILVGTTDETIFVDPSVIVSSYNDLYLLQFDDVKTAMYAYAYYKDKAEFVEVDSRVSIADESTAKESEPVIMNAEENPFTELEKALAEEEQDDASEETSAEQSAKQSADQSAEETGEAPSEASKEESYDIALIDTGADDVEKAVSVLGENAADDNGHGNLMAGIIQDRDTDVKILSIKALDENGTGTVSSVYAAIQLAMESNVRIINLSLSAVASADSRVIEEAIKEATEKGIVVVGAAGNKGANVKYFVPGKVEEALIIGACDENGVTLKTSNFGETVDYNIIAGTTSEATAQMSAILINLPVEKLETIVDQGFVFHTDYDPAEHTMDLPPLKGDPNFHAAGVRESGGAYYLDDFFGITRKQFVDFMYAREAAYDYNYYLNTPYGISWAESDSFYPNGAPRWDGYVGLNCAGFIRCAVKDAGGSLAYVENHCDRNGYDAPWGLAGASVWWSFMANESVLWRSYNTKAELLADKWAEQGDIIYCYPTDGGDTHIGFYWGTTPGEDLMWHSYHYNTVGGIRYGNKIGPIDAKTDGVIWYVFKWSPPAESDLVIKKQTTQNDPKLIIRKSVNDDSGSPKTKKFSYTVTYYAADTGRKTTTTFQLADGESKTLTCKPGTDYTVTEAEDDEYTVSPSRTQSGTVSGINLSREFSFKVTFTSPSGTTTTKTFSLSNGESKKYTNLEEGTSFVVEETESLNNKWTVTKSGATGTTVGGTDYTCTYKNSYQNSNTTVSFTNTRIPVPMKARKISVSSEVSAQFAGAEYEAAHRRISYNQMYSQNFSGATFRVHIDRTGTTVADKTYVTGNDGTISMDDVYRGDMITVTELKPPKGYMLPEENRIKFKVNADGTVTKDASVPADSIQLTKDDDGIAVRFEDMPLLDPNGISLRKVISRKVNGQWQAMDSLPVNGAVFRWDYYDNTNSNHTNDTPVRTWYFVSQHDDHADKDGEVRYKTAYLLTEEKVNNMSVSEEERSRLLGYAAVNENNPLFWKLNANGQKSAALPLGSLTISEVYSPPGYKLYEDTISATMTQDENDPNNYVITWPDLGNQEVKVGSNPAELVIGEREVLMALNKKDSKTGDDLDGSVFRITDMTDYPDVDTAHASSDRVLEFPIRNGHYLVKEFLQLGHSYVMEEVDFPDGYVLLEDDIFFHVTDAGEIVMDTSTSKDEDGNVITYVPSAEVVTMDENGTILSNPSSGTGYECLFLELKNTPNRLTLFKADPEKDGEIKENPMVNVSFQVYVKDIRDGEWIGELNDGTKIYNNHEFKTSRNGKFTMYKLRRGHKYYFQEIRTLEGKKLLAEPVTVETSAETGRIIGPDNTRTDGNIEYHMNVLNWTELHLFTGGTGTLLFYLAGALGIACVLTFVLISRRKRQNQ